MPVKHKLMDVTTAVMDKNIAWSHRQRLLMSMVSNEEYAEAVQGILEAAATSKVDELAEQRMQTANELIAALEDGPIRPATFVSFMPQRNGVRRAEVKFADGASAFLVVPDDELAAKLRRGEAVLVDGRMRAILAGDAGEFPTGEIARLVRRVEGAVIEISFPRDDETQLFVASELLVEKLDREEVIAGAMLRVCRRRTMAFDAIPQADGLSFYKFLCRDAVPDVVVERDMASPPKLIGQTLDHVRRCMTDPQLLERYRLRPFMSWMLVGPSGTGKTFCIQALWNAIYRQLSELTGAGMDELPPRVLRLRLSDVLSKFLGESDQRLARFWDEVEQLAEEKFTTPDGHEVELPVLVLCEEAEGFARQRGADQDAIYDRIQTTLLSRMDTTSQKLRNKLVICLFTTNVPQLLDSAVARRFGGNVEHFGRLDRRAFNQVLRKHIAGLPMQSHNGTSQDGLEKALAERITSWLYAPNSDGQTIVELTYIGEAHPTPRRMGEFLTPAIVDRAVQQAASQACSLQAAQQGPPGLSAVLVAQCIEQQVRSIVERLRRENVSEYLDLPEGSRVASIKKISRSPSLPLQLFREEASQTH
jgi:hypothetical protein